MEIERVQSMANTIYHTQEVYHKLTNVCDKTKQALLLSVEMYQEARLRLFEQDIKKSGRSWCTVCREVFDEKQITFLLRQEKYGGLEYVWDSWIVRVCQYCESELKRRCQYDQRNYCYDVSREGEGFVTHEKLILSGNIKEMIKTRTQDTTVLDGEKIHFPKPPETLIQRFSEEFNIPPFIEFSSHH